MFRKKGAFWLEVLKSKFGGWRGLLGEEFFSFSSVRWRDLKLVYDKGSLNGWFDRRVRWKIGKGDQARFWLDKWVGEEIEFG